ncbi:MAG: hypothetical protein ACR2G6_02060 [Gemmatimonadaceae bacterium]
MPQICYIKRKFAGKTMQLIEHANVILAEYQEQGFSLTLRQLYYQFVARDVLPNTQRSYKRLGVIISDARRAGLIDWDDIEDRTRELRGVTGYDSPVAFMDIVSQAYYRKLWDAQPAYVEVWFEKDALMGVFERAANEWRVPFFSCRGYTSDSEVWAAAQRLVDVGKERTIVLHFGDHDPSGIDMTRDITDRLEMFSECASEIEIRRIALTMEQVRQYNPPPNPAKQTDARYESYKRDYGNQSWELDALTPTVLAELVRDEIMNVLDLKAWEQAQAEEQAEREIIGRIGTEWPRVRELLAGSGGR